MFHSCSRTKSDEIKKRTTKQLFVGLKLSESPCSAGLVLALNVLLSACTLLTLSLQISIEFLISYHTKNFLKIRTAKFICFASVLTKLYFRTRDMRRTTKNSWSREGFELARFVLLKVNMHV